MGNRKQITITLNDDIYNKFVELSEMEKFKSITSNVKNNKSFTFAKLVDDEYKLQLYCKNYPVV